MELSCVMTAPPASPPAKAVNRIYTGALGWGQRNLITRTFAHSVSAWLILCADAFLTAQISSPKFDTCFVRREPDTVSAAIPDQNLPSKEEHKQHIAMPSLALTAIFSQVQQLLRLPKDERIIEIMYNHGPSFE